MIELYQQRVSFLHQTNARVKFLFTLVFVLCVGLSPGGAWPAYVLFLTLIAVEIVLSELSIKRLFLRSLISLPFVLAAFPLLFTGTEPRQSIMVADQFRFTFSQPGLIHFISIAIKSWLSILAAIVLTSTTRYEDLLSAIRQLGLPKFLVAILMLMWRYLSVIIDEARSLVKARDSRSAGKTSPDTIVWRAEVTGKMVGNLLLRSLERSERVYAAMCSRGYTGEPLHLASSRLTKTDYFALLIGTMLCFMIFTIATFTH